MENGLLETNQEVKNMLEEEKDERAGQSQVKRWINTSPVRPSPLYTQEIIHVELAKGPGVARGKKLKNFRIFLNNSKKETLREKKFEFF